MLSIFRKSFLGECRNDIILNARDLKKREITIALVLSLVVLIFGFFPQLILGTIEVSAQEWVNLFSK
jgi:NADH-quinone oxidoreductase subunit M